MYTFRTILHPTDFSERSENAFRLACALARTHGAKVVVLHVQPPEVFPAMDVLPPLPNYEQERQWREEMLHRLSAEPHVRIEYHMAEGEPAGHIVETARQLGCDLIILGTHGRTGLSRLLLGSVAEQVLRTAPCPVLTVREPIPELLPIPVSQPVLAQEPERVRQAEPEPLPALELGVGD